MATTTKRLGFVGDSLTVGGTGGSFRHKVFMARPDFKSNGSVQDIIIAPADGYIPNPFTGVERKWHFATVGYSIGVMGGVIVSRLGAAAFPTTTHLVITLGTNDILGGVATATSLSNYGTMLDAIHSFDLNIKIGVMTIPNLNLFSGGTYAAATTALNSGLSGVVSARSSYVCLGTMPYDLATYEYQDNQKVHPNDRGNTRCANAILAMMAANSAFFGT
jgi:hypothetical protein